MSHHRASALERASPSENPDSNAYWAEDESEGCICLLGGAQDLLIIYFRAERPHCISFSCISSTRVMCADLCFSDGISSMIKFPVSVWCSSAGEVSDDALALSDELDTGEYAELLGSKHVSYVAMLGSPKPYDRTD